MLQILLMIVMIIINPGEPRVSLLINHGNLHSATPTPVMTVQPQTPATKWKINDWYNSLFMTPL